ncbi:hypothetical protein E2C01_024559 [Portunus trituberculatus]|uniref:Uncharacterized protein n=1 Tax=Portunus trituberculatus TaxID=210409 RepID=A0A5B7EF32_PORTR|nr:hypothetical protein [Portunus trituberculatus]
MNFNKILSVLMPRTLVRVTPLRSTSVYCHNSPVGEINGQRREEDRRPAPPVCLRQVGGRCQTGQGHTDASV